MKYESLAWHLSQTYRSLPPVFYAEGQQAHFPQPEIVLFNAPLAHELGLLAAPDAPINWQATAAALCGNQFPAKAQPIAQAYAGHQFGHFTMLGDGRALADYALARHFPQMQAERPGNPYPALLQAVIARQAQLMARWQLVGFIHGVMNSDNMAVSGETIDYGPCAFMDAYDPATVFSSIDRDGRYRYENQPLMAQWNLARLAEALLPLLDADEQTAVEIAQQALQQFEPLFVRHYYSGLGQKLGLFEHQKNDTAWMDQLLQLMHTHAADYTNTFVRLTLEMAGADGAYLDGTAALLAAPAFADWKRHWQAQLAKQSQSLVDAAGLMRSVNPFVIARNHRVEAALAAAETNDMRPFNELLAVLQQPFSHNAAHRMYQRLPEQSTDSYQTFCGT